MIDANSIMAIGAGLVGMVMHVMKKKVKGESLSSVVEYFKGHTKYTAMAVATLVGSIYAMLNTMEFANTYALITQALTIGYMVDSTMNKDGGQ